MTRLACSVRATPATLEGNERLTLVARFGVGYDNIDVPACTAQWGVLDHHPGGGAAADGRRQSDLHPGAGGRLLEQDRLTREGRWADKQDARGTGLVGKTLGTIGFGRIAQETHRIARPLGMRHIAYDPYAIAAVAEAEGVELTDLETLLKSRISSSWRRR